MTHIQMHDDYTQTTKYSGILDDKHPFTVSCDYDSYQQHYEVLGITWEGDHIVKNRKKAEKKIKDFVSKWLFEKPVEKDEKEI